MEHNISRIYPEVESITIKSVEDNGWTWNRQQEFTYTHDMEASFCLECPRPKCLGKVRGICFKQTVDEMVRRHETNRKEKFNCRGYDGYNFNSHCEWYAVLDISIIYRCV